LSAEIEVLSERVWHARKKAVERAIADYYDALSGGEIEEQRRWGEFALEEFPRETPPAERQTNL